MSLKSKALSELLEGSRVFIDANIFVYHVTEISAQASEFLARCERGEIWGVTSTNVLLEALHRLMIIEARAKGLITSGNMAKKLKENPHLVKQLKEYQEQTAAILELGLEVLPLDAESVKISERYREEYGLLVNDSVTVALALSQGILALASSDRDFERVRELTVYKPTDIKV